MSDRLKDVRYSVYRCSDGLPVIIHGNIAQCARAMGVCRKTFDSFASCQRRGSPKASQTWDIVREDENGEPY